jgi:hypothetical protein
MLRLGSRETLLWTGTAAGLAVALTDARIIAITRHWHEWQTKDFGVHDSEPLFATAGEDFILVVTNDRVVTLSARGGSFVETKLGAYERVIDSLFGDRVAIVVTNRRVIGYSSPFATLSETSVGIHERLHSANAGYDFATVATDKRLLVFDAPSGAWSSRRLGLN